MSAEFVYPCIVKDSNTGRFTTTVMFGHDSNPAVYVPGILKILREHPRGLRERVDGLTISVRGDQVRIYSLDREAVDMTGCAFSFHMHALSSDAARSGWTGYDSVMTFCAP